MSQKDGFLDSLTDAFRVSNIFFKLLMFLVFGILTAFPYVIHNLDKVYLIVQQSGATGFMIFLTYVKAIAGAVWMGIWIGLSTLFNAITHFGTVMGERQFGTIFYCILILIFATMFFYQPIRLLFNVLDMKRGRTHSMTFVAIVSLVLVLILFAPLASLITGGTTLTSGVSNDDIDESSDSNEVVNGNVSNSTNINDNTVVNNAMATLDLLNLNEDGGG